MTLRKKRKKKRKKKKTGEIVRSDGDNTLWSYRCTGDCAPVWAVVFDGAVALMDAHAVEDEVVLAAAFAPDQERLPRVLRRDLDLHGMVQHLVFVQAPSMRGPQD
jgi:hypothetical protein